MCHNETVNIWTHLLGAVFFFSMIYYVLFVMTDMVSLITHDVLIAEVPVWPLFVYIISAITLLTGSWYYHLHSCVS
jgi:predicted membrane channel-forming protein YqfA (hemolysin III family)